MQVIATQVGYIDHIRRKEGEKFEVPDGSMSSWFEPTDEKVVEEYRKKRDAAHAKATAPKTDASLSEARAKIDKLTAELGDANDKIDKLTAELGDANDKLADATPDEEAIKAAVEAATSDLKFELAEANAKIKKLEKK